MYIRDMCSDHNSDCTFMHIVHKYWSRHFRSPGGHSVLRRGRGAEIACLPTCILYLSTTKQARTSGSDCKYLPFGASQRWRERIEPGIPRPPRTVRRGDNYLHVQHAALFFLMGARKTLEIASLGNNVKAAVMRLANRKLHLFSRKLITSGCSSKWCCSLGNQVPLQFWHTAGIKSKLGQIPVSASRSCRVVSIAVKFRGWQSEFPFVTREMPTLFVLPTLRRDVTCGYVTVSVT